jgi:putative two-component system response regulator
MKTPDPNVPLLVVDDDPEELKATCKALGSLYPLLTAVSGQDALRIAREARPCAIVLDVMLAGGIDGFAVFNELRHDPATRQIPVIFLTSVNQITGLPFCAGALGRYLGAEPAAFLEKPVSASALCGEVERVLNKERGA